MNAHGVKIAGFAASALLAGSAIAGCSSSTSSVPNAGSHGGSIAPLPAASATVGTGTDWKFIPITSKNVAEAGYDAATFTLVVKFKRGAVYSYSPVPPVIWQQFQDAQPDPWIKVGKPYLVDGGVPYHQLQ